MDKGKLIAAIIGLVLGVAGSLLGYPNLKGDVCGEVAPAAAAPAPVAQ